MLYVTTRDPQNAIPVGPVLTQNRGAEGGLLLPMHFPKLTDAELERFGTMSCNQRMAELLNCFFSTKLTSWDIDFAIGRYPVRQEVLPHRIHMAELWHNPRWHYSRLVSCLSELTRCEAMSSGSWGAVAVRMAVLAGLLGDPAFRNGDLTDIAMVSGDFTAPISAWYLRKMGFPIGNILCCCNENNQLWDLVCHGQLRTDMPCITTTLPEADVTLPVDLERLIFECGGSREVMQYLECCATGSPYFPPEISLRKLQQGLYVSVVSSSRVERVVPNVWKSHNYLLTPASALAYSGLLDYRAKTGITRTALVLCDQGPQYDLQALGKVMHLSAEAVAKLI